MDGDIGRIEMVNIRVAGRETEKGMPAPAGNTVTSVNFLTEAEEARGVVHYLATLGVWNTLAHGFWCA